MAALEYRKDKWYEVTGIVIDGKLYRLRIRRLTPESVLDFRVFLTGPMKERKASPVKASCINKQAIV